MLPNIWTEEDYRKYWSYTDKERALYAMWERNAQRDEDLHARLADARAEAKQRNKPEGDTHAIRSTD